MRIRKNGKVISLTESDLMRITRKVLREQDDLYGNKAKEVVNQQMSQKIINALNNIGVKVQEDEKGTFFDMVSFVKEIPKYIQQCGVTFVGKVKTIGSEANHPLPEFCKNITESDKNELKKYIPIFVKQGILKDTSQTSYRSSDWPVALGEIRGAGNKVYLRGSATKGK